ncbi:MAG: hypothetical protein IJI14_08150 [Anaerolineaceae bacterium]|nr:hypothetical protein [Anaerolineaceae bacterium]
MSKRKIPPDTPYFHYHNANPYGKITGDCLHRAISLATGVDWKKTAVVYALWGVKTGLTACSGNDVDSLLQEFGPWHKHPMPKHFNGARYTIAELCQEFGQTKHPVLVSCAHHLTCIKDGKVWDTWNCTRKCCGNYWTLE